ncbi:hypothetical protein [Thermoactinospora rubra]|uniref:hypothetical protein n=1 Tax=Thermoactinospora rubra TaxID=1088767 RepID=UPI000A1150DA|nr:hypothetical protein [Thermoactinospora rubra]
MTTKEVESGLSTGIFGDSRSLRANSDIFYKGVTELFADVFPGFTLTWPWPGSPYHQILIRGYLDESLIHLRTSRERAQETALDLIDLLGQAPAGPDVPSQPLVTMTGWTGNPLGERIIDRFHQTMRNDGHDFTVEMLEPSANAAAAVERARDLLHELLPDVAPPTTSLVRGLALFEGDLSSAFVNGTPLLVYLSADLLEDPLETADALLHECLHQKLVEVRLTRRMLRDGYSDDTSHKILVPWGGAGRLFSVDRSMAAFHVYVHCALLHLAAADRAELLGLTAAEVDERLVCRWARADFFGAALSTPEAGAELGLEGRRLVRWLRSANDRLGTATTTGGVPLAEYAGAYGP